MAFPAAARSAWARLLSPWGGSPRYTFAALEDLPSSMVVPHGEPFTVTAKLASETVWHPAQADAQFDGQSPVTAGLGKDDLYDFEMPSQIETGWLTIQVGDASRMIKIEPTLRPELTSLVASVTLPDYLGRPGAAQGRPRRDHLAGEGEPRLVRRDRQPRPAVGPGRTASRARPRAPRSRVPRPRSQGTRKMEFRWKDTFGLEGKEPFSLSIAGRDDEAPSLACEDLPRQKVVLDSELLSFKVHAQDDFGVRRVGMEWQGMDIPDVSKPAKGERILGAGGQDQESLELAGTFSAKSLGIEPQPVQVRMFVEDYFPGRPRVYSPPYTFFVLTPEQHAIWITEQLSRWHRQAIEVRDREM